jgi:FkbM family methyltransferase
MINTYSTKYGEISLYDNEFYIGSVFKKGEYWDEDTLVKLKEYIPPDRNILEIGGHCGTSSIVYASFINDDKKVYVYEPQKNMYELLVKNISDNNLQDKIIPFNKGVFCYNGFGNMNNIDLDGRGGIVSNMYENSQPCNFGGICLGKEGEQIEMLTIDSMNLEDIGFIHCDAQGSENFIFSESIQTVNKYRPVVFYEDNAQFAHYLYNTVCNNYPEYTLNSKFNIKEYFINNLHYSTYIERFNSGLDNLLIP